jgi:hypothetical protein
VRVLIQMPYSGYLRMYGSTVLELAERGHDVALAYDKPDKRREPAADEIEQASGVCVVGAVPLSRRVWSPLAKYVRLAVDYVRYLDPRFAATPWLRRRMDKFLPKGLRWLRSAPVLPGPLARAAVAFLLLVERAIPSDPAVEAYLRSVSPDVVIVTPLVMRGPGGALQTETVKACRALGIPVAVAVSSWDHLTSKGLIRATPDRVIVWNEGQKAEAVDLHGVDPSIVVLTGAQLFDVWFEKRPTLSREAFMAQVGLDAARPYVLYVGSSPNITVPEKEVAYVRRWIGALRSSEDEAVRGAGVLVRPHPGNAAHWATVDVGDLENVTIWPRERPSMPMSEADEENYFHSIVFSEAVVGINTSAIIESSIVGRPVHTVLDGEFDDTQHGTLHFKHLAPENGGCLITAGSLDEHAGQLAVAVHHPERLRPRIEGFVGSFVRPHGRERPATPILADTIEDVARLGPLPARRVPRRLVPLTAALRLVSLGLRRA